MAQQVSSITNVKKYSLKLNSFLLLNKNNLKNISIWLFPPIEQADKFITHFENMRQEIPNEISFVIVIPRLVTPGALYKRVLSKYKCIHAYPSGTYLFSRPLDDSPFEK